VTLITGLLCFLSLHVVLLSIVLISVIKRDCPKIAKINIQKAKPVLYNRKN